MPGWPIRKNEAGTLPVLVFPIYDADGDLVSGAADLDSERSIDQGTFTDCTAEAAEIATSSGMYSLAPTQAELNGDEIAFITKTSTAGAKTAVNVVYTSTRNIDDLAYPATSGRSLQVETDGHVHADLKEWLGVAPNALQSGRVDSYVGALAAAVITTAAWAAGAIDAAAIAADAIGASEFAQGAADLVWSSAARTLTALGFNLANTDFAAGAIDANAIAAGAITASEAPNLDAAMSTRATPAQVNTEVSDVLKTDTIPELAQGIPSATPTFEDALMLLYMALRNQLDIDTSGATDYKEIYNDAGTVICKKVLTDDGSTYSEAKMVSGP